MNIRNNQEILKQSPEKQKVTFQNAVGIGRESLEYIDKAQKSIQQLINEKNPKYPNTVLVRTKDLQRLNDILKLADKNLTEVLDKLKNVNPAIDHWEQCYKEASNQLLKILECNIQNKEVAA